MSISAREWIAFCGEAESISAFGKASIKMPNGQTLTVSIPNTAFPCYEVRWIEDVVMGHPRNILHIIHRDKIVDKPDLVEHLSSIWSNIK